MMKTLIPIIETLRKVETELFERASSKHRAAQKLKLGPRNRKHLQELATDSLSMLLMTNQLHAAAEEIENFATAPEAPAAKLNGAPAESPSQLSLF